MNADRVRRVFRMVNKELASKGIELDYKDYAAIIRRDWYPGMPDEIIREPYGEYRLALSLFEERGGGSG